jgi:hypothetical protein
MLSVGAAGLLAVFAPQEAAAIPAFSRQTGKSCTTCHSAFPKLNQTGQNFRTNGFRFPEDGEWQEVQDLKHVPLSAEIEIEGEFEREAGGGQATLLHIDEVALLAGSPLGKNGRASAYGVVNFATGGVDVGQAYVQVNDLIGATGNGLLNVKSGQFEVALPFLSSTQRVIKTRYLAQQYLGILGSNRGNNGAVETEHESGEIYNTGVELNGQIVGKEATDLTHRYAVGLIQPRGLNDANRLGQPGLYATYAVNFLENFNLGLIYKRDVVNSTLDPFTPNGKRYVNKYGIAGDAKVGPFIATLAYFRSDGLPNTDFSGNFVNNDPNRSVQNYMAEILFIPNKTWVVGGRFDHLDQELRQSTSRTTVMGRYNITASIYLQGEWRVQDGGGAGPSSGDDTFNGRAFLVALF